MKIAINGFGRIGRNILRSYILGNRLKEKSNDIEIIAINDLSTPQENAHLLKYDSVHGKLDNTISHSDKSIIVDGNEICCFSEKDPSRLPWSRLEIDLVFECTGLFTSRVDAHQHINAGAKRVLLSAPGKNVDKTIVYGVNHYDLNSNDLIISNASCTTNCLAPIAKVIHDNFKIEYGLANTVHAYTNDQSLLDMHHSDPLRARAANLSMIPSRTGAASTVGEVLPELKERLDGLAIRVPVANVSLLDFTFSTEHNFSLSALDDAIISSSANEMNGIISINSLPLVSSDFGKDPHSAIYDMSHTKKVGNVTKILAWYDNEWGFSNRMLDVAIYLNQLN